MSQFLGPQQLLHIAIKRRMQEAGYYSGDLDENWKQDAQRAWQAFCTRVGFRYSETPDLGLQEPVRAATLTQWIEAETAIQREAGVSTTRPVRVRTLYDLVKTHAPQGAELVTLDDDMTEAQRAKRAEDEANLERPEEIVQQEMAQRQALEEERRASIQATLRAARRIVKRESAASVSSDTEPTASPEAKAKSVPAPSGPKKIKSGTKINKIAPLDEGLLRTRS